MDNYIAKKNEVLLHTIEMFKTDSSSSGSILLQIVANCSYLYPLVASGLFGSCLHQQVVTSCPFLHGSFLFQEVVLLVGLMVLVVFLLVSNAFFTVIQLVVLLFVLVVIQSSCLFGLVLKQFEYKIKKHMDR